jgi:cytochrome c-type biogenesis protein CcmH/NrfG
MEPWNRAEWLGVVPMAQPHHGIRPPHDGYELLWRRALAACPGDARLHAGLGLHLSTRGHDREARAAIDEAIRLDPTYADAHYVASLIVNLSSPRLKQKLRVAIVEVKEAIRLDSGKVAYHTWLVELLIRCSRFRFGRRLALASVRAADERLRLDPLHARCHLLRGRALARLGRHEEAIDAFITARNLDPESSEPYRELGLCLVSLNDMQGAEESLREALRLAPEDALNRLILSNIASTRRLRACLLKVASALCLLRMERSEERSVMHVNWLSGVLLSFVQVSSVVLLSERVHISGPLPWCIGFGLIAWTIMIVRKRFVGTRAELSLKILAMYSVMFWQFIAFISYLGPEGLPHDASWDWGWVREYSPLILVRVLGICSSVGLYFFALGVFIPRPVARGSQKVDSEI